VATTHERGSRDKLTEVAAAADSISAVAAPAAGRRRGDSKLRVPSDDLAALARIARSQTATHRAVRRSRILLALASGASERDAARQERVSRGAVRRWGQRYLDAGLAGVLSDRPGRGRRASLQVDLVPRLQIAARALKARGEPVTLRRLAREMDLSYSALQRLNARTGRQLLVGLATR
jgi:transposase